MARDDFEDADQLRIGNDGIFMLTFFSKCLPMLAALFYLVPIRMDPSNTSEQMEMLVMRVKLLSFGWRHAGTGKLSR